jgi:purine nucleosidase
MPKKIIVDCDPGHDDAIALLLAHGSPEIELLAITTVMGNSTLENVTRNALAVATIGGIGDVPIAAGCARPLVGEVKIADLIHGRTGLDGPRLPEPTCELDPRHAVDVIIETVLREDPGTVTLVPTAALTNIAMAVRKQPCIAERVAEVVLMGGAVSGGNSSATGEFNIITDPEAAHIVFGERWPVTMVGLDLTHQALATPNVVARIAAIGTSPARFVTQVLEFFGDTYRAVQGFPHPPLHDPCAVARVIDPGMMTTQRAPLVVELTGRHTRGMTVADLRAPVPPGCRTEVAVDLDHDRFWDLVVDALERIGEP